MFRRAIINAPWQSTVRVTVAVALIAVFGSVAFAVPYTDNFDALITELEVRSNTLTNTTDKIEVKQKKAVDKVLATLNGKDSTSVATDLKNAGKVAKSLQKAFPNEFVVDAMVAGPLDAEEEHNLGNLVAGVFEAFRADIQGNVDALQAELAGLPNNECKANVQEQVEGVQAILDTPVSSPLDPIIVKLLSSAIKGLSKIEGAVDDIPNCGGGGGGGGDADMTAQISFNGGPAQAFEGAAAGVFVGLTGQLSVTGVSVANPMRSVTISAVNVTGPGTYTAGAGTAFVENAGSLDQITYAHSITGTLHLTSFNLAAQTATGTFSYNASQTTPFGNGTVEITSGSFTIDTIQEPF